MENNFHGHELPLSRENVTKKNNNFSENSAPNKFANTNARW